MMTPYSTNTVLDLLAGKPANALSSNEDIVAHQDDIHAAQVGFPLRLLPGFIRRPLRAWIAARKYERSLVNLWEVSPHLLSDVGIVLTSNGELPDHLVAAPARVIDHVAAISPEQIVEAEKSYPSVTQGAFGPEEAPTDIEGQSIAARQVAGVI